MKNKIIKYKIIIDRDDLSDEKIVTHLISDKELTEGEILKHIKEKFGWYDFSFCSFTYHKVVEQC